MIRAFIEKMLFANKQLTHDIVILDDIFPHLLSPFRIKEFNAILEHFDSAAVYSSGTNFRALGKKRRFANVHSEYAKAYPDYSKRVYRYNRNKKVDSRLGYLLFLNNACYFFDFLEKYSIPFVLELYPGGGFRLNDSESDSKLRKIVSSPLLRKVVVTQKVTFDYLVDNKFCAPDKVDFVFGVVLPSEELEKAFSAKHYFPRDKSQVDICFVAHKYMEKGRDKGYDVFIEVAHALADSIPNLSFHVVGPFDAKDIDITKISDRLTFYGSRTTEFFPEFYAGMDLILSPNAPNILSPGAFDGFPTGACVEAGLCGTAVFACDELGLNPFIDGEELVIIPRDHQSIVDIVLDYLRNPELLYNVSQRGQKKFIEVFSLECQMAPRIRILESLLNEGSSQHR